MGSQQFDRQTVISATTNMKTTVIQGSASDVVNVNAYERFTILSPKNTVSKVFNCIFGWNMDTNQGSGYRECIIDTMISDGTTTGRTGLGMCKIHANYNSDCQYNQGTGWDQTALTPNDLNAFASQIHSIQFDDTYGMQMVFYNAMPYTTAMQRYWYIFVNQEVVAR